MALFTGDIDQLRSYVPGLTLNYTTGDIGHELARTEDVLLRPFLGDVTEQIVSLADSLPTDLSVIERRAVHLARVSVARIGLANYLPFAEIQIGDDGITITAMEGRKAAFEYQTKKVERRLRDEGWRALDELVTLVAKHEATFPDWPESPYYAEHQEALFKTPAEFSHYYPIQDRWLTFWALRPFIRAVEEDRGEAAQERIDALPVSVTDAQRAKIKRALLRALAYQTVIEAVPNLSVELDSANVQVNYASQYGNAEYYQPPGKDHLTWVLTNLQKQCDLAWNTFDDALTAAVPTTTDTNSGSGFPYSTGAITMF